jgi:hypothetical protein
MKPAKLLLKAMSAPQNLRFAELCRLAEADNVADPRTQIERIMSSPDALITAKTQKLEARKTHEKGLMQKLFPSPEEVKP